MHSIFNKLTVCEETKQLKWSSEIGPELVGKGTDSFDG
jgi:hypothetical protein